MTDTQLSCDYCPMPRAAGMTTCVKCAEAHGVTQQASLGTLPSGGDVGDIALISVFRRVCDEAAARGATEISAHYAGSGDDGSIDSPNVDTGDDLNDADSEVVRDMMHRILDRLHGGWEINEGSQGDIIIELESHEIRLEHSVNVVTTEDDYSTFTFDNLLGTIRRGRR